MRISDETFDCIVHPTSNLFVPDVKPVWRECYRVLKSGGTLIAGFCNPIMYMFDLKLEQQGILQVKYAVSYSDQLYQYACYHTGIKTGLLSRAGRYNTR
ncbi:MAG: methyltransferase domain-containing protein [Dehalococcoidales bacterium]|nr:methyltransferase domain-containing protein [Dehalococcoidales bacterium]